MTITAVKEIKTKSTKEVEVPAYYKFGSCLFKILSDKDYIEVASDSDEIGISHKSMDAIVGLVANDGEEISEKEFAEAHENVLKLLNTNPQL